MKDNLMNVLKLVKENFGLIKDIGIILFMVIILYFNAHFVSLEKFEAAQEANRLAHQSIQTSLVSVDKTLALMQQNQAALIENEKQIKINTGRLGDIEGKYKYFEEQIKTVSSIFQKSSEMDARIKILESLELDKYIKQNILKMADYEVRIKLLEAFNSHRLESTTPPVSKIVNP
jgi:hypothetical protein